MEAEQPDGYTEGMFEGRSSVRYDGIVVQEVFVPGFLFVGEEDAGGGIAEGLFYLDLQVIVVVQSDYRDVVRVERPEEVEVEGVFHGESFLRFLRREVCCVVHISFFEAGGGRRCRAGERRGCSTHRG